MSESRRTLGYLSAAPRVSTRPDATEGGARAHVLGVIHGFEQRGWIVRPYIVGDALPRAGSSSARTHDRSRGLRPLAVDVARMGMGAINARRAWQQLGSNVDLVYERFASLQSLGHVFKAHGVPWILETNALMFQEARLERKSLILWRQAQRREIDAYRRCDMLVCISEALRSTVLRHTGVPANKVVVIPNGVDTTVFDPAKHATLRVFNEPTIGFVGSLYHWQRLDLLLRAVDALRTEGISWHVAIVGDGAAGAEWEQLAHTLGMHETVRFLGRLAWNKVPPIMNGFDVGFSGQAAPVGDDQVYFSPLKLYEYMAMAKPVIATGSEDAVRLVGSGGHGFLFEAGRVDDLKRALRKAWLERERLPTVGHAARSEVEAHHSWNARVDQLLRNAAAVIGGSYG